jgi:2-keto-4-pentenoate hydratase/2-oxohepta-3-ene-1,7-dioic acid hydratase in catechol pathway
MPLIYRVIRGGRAQHAVVQDGELREVEGDVFGQWRPGASIAGGLAAATICAPVSPSKIVCVGLNYREHAAEQGKPLPEEPLIFLKPSTAVIGHGEPIRLPAGAGRVDHEAEVGVVIGRVAARVPASRASDVIFGVTCVNDVTARDIQRRENKYTRAKGFDTFAPVGPAILPAAGVDLHTLAVEGWVNGERRQSSSTAQLIFPIDELVAFISNIMTLLPGDIISTGTPSGIGPLAAGDEVTVRVAGVGALTNPVVAG